MPDNYDISVDISENITKVEVTEDTTTINITPDITTVELKGISIANAGAASSVSYDGDLNTLGEGTTLSTALDHININGLNKNLDQQIDGNITFTGGKSITIPAFTSSGENALVLNNNHIASVGDITTTGTFTTSGNISSSGTIITTNKIKAPFIEGALEGGTIFHAVKDGSVTLARGDAVYIAGSSEGQTLVDKAIASDSSKMPAFGLVNSVSGNDVDVIILGSFSGIDSTGISIGDELYVSDSTAGSFTSAKPSGESNTVQKIGILQKVGDATSTTISTPTPEATIQKIYVKEFTRAADGNTVTLKLGYSCGMPYTTGVGFTFNFDKKYFTKNSVSNFSPYSTASGELNSEGNSMTFAWASTSSLFPGLTDATLVTIVLNVESTADGTDTDFTFTETSSASGFTFSGQTQTIRNVIAGSQATVGEVGVVGSIEQNSIPNLNTGNFFLGVNNVSTASDFPSSTAYFKYSSASAGSMLMEEDLTVTVARTVRESLWMYPSC